MLFLLRKDKEEYFFSSKPFYDLSLIGQGYIVQHHEFSYRWVLLQCGEFGSLNWARWQLSHFLCL